MDKKRLVSFLLAFFFSAYAVLPVFADIGYGLSMSLDIIAEKSRIKKCGVKNMAIYFDKSDFDKLLGTGDYVTVSTLPDKALGTLYLGDRKISEGQTLSRTSAAQMHFEPKADTLGKSEFTFCDPAAKNRYGVMTLYVLEELNLCPTVSEASYDTEKNISYKGYLEAHDPEGDKLYFAVTSSPKHGTLQLLDKESGFFMYTPKADFTGRDTFSVRAQDSYGNRSEQRRMIIHINEKSSDTVFYDMTNHWAHTSAAVICDNGLLRSENVDGRLMFYPEREISRGDFLAIAMIGAGLEPYVKRVFSTDFYDDAQIPVNIKSYAMAAKEMGIINGYIKEGSTVFDSASPITRHDAALIVSRILKFSGDPVTDAYEAGIFIGTGKGERSEELCVTRAQTARIYCNIADHFETRSDFTFSSSAVTYAE